MTTNSTRETQGQYLDKDFLIIASGNLDNLRLLCFVQIY